MAQAELSNSVTGRIHYGISVFTEPLGFDWRTNLALVGGFAAMEAVFTTMGTAYSLGEVDPEEAESLGARLSKEPSWTSLTAFTLIIFLMIEESV